MVPGKRFDRYYELGQEAFGEKLGLWIVVPQQLIVGVGVDIVYMVTGGKSLEKFYHLTCKKNCYLQKRLSIWILVFGCVHLFLAQLPNFNSIAGISLAAAIMSLRWVKIFCDLPCVYWRLPGCLGGLLFLSSNLVLIEGPCSILQLLNNCMGHPCPLWTLLASSWAEARLSFATKSINSSTGLWCFQCIGNNSICICWPQRRAGDTSHNPINSSSAIKNCHVERSPGCLWNCGCMLLPCCYCWLLGIR